VAEAIETARRDVPVDSRDGRYSEREPLDRSGPLLAERGVTGVSTLPDGSGAVGVGLRGGPRAAGSSGGRRTAAHRAVRRAGTRVQPAGRHPAVLGRSVLDRVRQVQHRFAVRLGGRLHEHDQHAQCRAVGKGDSGGPVLALNNLVQQHVALAKGTISAGSGSLGPCQLS
jgi:hypothetical protein